MEEEEADMKIYMPLSLSIYLSIYLYPSICVCVVRVRMLAWTYILHNTEDICTRIHYLGPSVQSLNPSGPCDLWAPKQVQHSIASLRFAETTWLAMSCSCLEGTALKT